MKVLQINSVAGIGSTGRIVYGIGDLILRNGGKSYVAYGRKAVPGNNILIKIGNKFDILFHVLVTRFSDKHGLASKQATIKLTNEITKIDPDIIHLHNIHGYYLNYELLFDFLAKYGKPVVWTLHDCWAITGHCPFFDNAGCDKWKHGCYQCQQHKLYPKSIVDDSYKNYIKKRESFTSIENMTLVPVSNWLNRLLQDSLLKTYDSLVIHNGIDTEKFIIKKTSVLTSLRDKGIHIVLGVANIWEPRKGLNDIIKLLDFLPNNFNIVLIGVSSKQNKKLPTRIICIEHTNNKEELAEYYNAADVFVNPTYEDNYPTTNLEAIACGTPVVTYNTGGCQEAIGEGTGIVVEKGNVEVLAAAVKEMAIYKSTPNSMCNIICRKYAEKHFSDKECFKPYIELYNKILSKL